MKEITDASGFNRSQYDLGKPPLQNYLGSQGLRSLVDERLMMECSERFDAMREAHREAVYALDDEIDDIKQKHGVR